MSSNQEAPSCCSATPKPKPTRQRYRPLFILIALSLIAALERQWGGGQFEFRPFMHFFMGTFLFLFATLKLLDLSGFATSFRKYDLLASRVCSYAKVYPFLELALAFGYLSQWQPEFVYLTTIILMSFGALGVFRALAKRLDVNCACMGSTLNVPLSTVAIFENLGMVSMAFYMLLKSSV